ncbi:hypothetical protein SKAU_G00074720 [Synaphobranchus kaupii]|uniref:Cadherin domain-containing protein n=1 Tax=Synaphobranchus kaupii TaxID=118154 RepID=A0A9Q1JC31_SYNKA|nr:hypothetical protein SKAU_G00074720 [Synaphobranchus kaupii]
MGARPALGAGPCVFVWALAAHVLWAQALVPHWGLAGRPVAGGERGELLHRARRGWVWNQFFVLEEYTGLEPLYIGKLHSDMDRGDGSIRYILSGEGAGTTFTIDDSTGDIHAIQRLDREVKALYVLRAQALQRQTGRPLEPESEFIVKIQDINDNEPKFLDGPYQASVPEMSVIGTSVIQLTASDADDPTYGNSARVVYSVLQGQPYFSVEPRTGIVRVSLADMDRELGGLAGTTTLNITLTDVNDNPPKFAQKLYQMSVPESAPVGSVVGRIRARDRDEGENAEIRYTIIDGDGRDSFDISTDPTNQFGIITIKKRLDFESKRSYTLKVEGANTHLDARFLSRGSLQRCHHCARQRGGRGRGPRFRRPLLLRGGAGGPGDRHRLQDRVRPRPRRGQQLRQVLHREGPVDPGKYFYIDITSGALMTVQPLDPRGARLAQHHHPRHGE